MQRLASLLFAPLLLLAASPTGSAQAAVLVVDQLGGPGSQYTSIVDAVAAASDGDVILVRPGGYQPFVVDGKALVLAADAPAGFEPTLFHTGIDHPTIKNLAASQSVVLRGFRMSADLGVATELEIESCAGPVLIEDVSLSGGGPCLVVRQSAAVVLSRCTLAGQDSLQGGGYAASIAVEAVDSRLTLYECTLRGGTGFDGYFDTAPDMGRDALHLEGGQLYAAGTVFRGGDGGNGAIGTWGVCYTGADAGDGLVLGPGASGDPVATTLDCAFQGGVGGDGISACMPGDGGFPVVLASGSHQKLPGTHGTLLSTSPLREGAASQLELWGPSGGLVLLLLAPTQQPAFEPFVSGVVVPALGTTKVLTLGGASPAGYLLVPFSAGQLPAGVDASGLYLQPAFVDFGAGLVTVGAPSHLLFLDQAL